MRQYYTAIYNNKSVLIEYLSTIYSYTILAVKTGDIWNKTIYGPTSLYSTTIPVGWQLITLEDIEDPTIFTCLL